MLSAVILSVHSYPAMLLAEQLVHQRYVHPGPLVLGTNPVKFPTRIADRDRTVSRRSEPSSRTTLIGEQPNPWDLSPAPGCDEPTSRCQTPRRYGLLGVSACYPRRTFYPLSDGPSTRNHRITMTVFRLCSTCTSRSQGRLLPLHSKLISDQPEPTIARLVTLWATAPSQTTHHTGSHIQIMDDG